MAQVFGVVPSGSSADMAGLSPEPARPGSELSARVNNVLRALRGRKELYQVAGAALVLWARASPRFWVRSGA